MAGSRYARGSKAWGLCERSGKKMLLKDMMYDGEWPDMLVSPDEYDPQHPQEYIPDEFDPETLYDPTTDLDKASSEQGDIRLPIFDFSTTSAQKLPLMNFAVNYRGIVVQAT